MANPNLEVADAGSDVNLSGNFQAGQQAAANKPTLWDGVGAAYRQDTLLYALLNVKHPRPLDPDYRIQDDWKRLTDGIPMEFHGKMLDANSAADGDRIRGDIQQELQDKQTLGSMGGVGTALHLGASVLDPVSLGAFSLTGPLGASRSASVLARMAKNGLVTGATVAGIEGGLVTSQQTKDHVDIWHGAAFGGVLGTVAGAFSKPVVDGMVGTLGRGQADATLSAAERTAAGEAELTRIRQETHEATGGTPTGDHVVPLNVDANGNAVESEGLGVDSKTGNPNKLGDRVDQKELEALKAAPHSDPVVVEKARGHVDSAFGETGLAAKLEESGHIKFVSTEKDLPKSVQDPRGTNAFYDAVTDTTFVVADRLHPGNAKGIILHDVGVHQTLERVMGVDLYRKMISEVDRLAAKGDAAATKALERAEKSGAKDFVKGEEKLGYYLEHVADHDPGLLRTMIARAKVFMRERFGVDMNLTRGDMLAIIRGSIKRSIAEGGPGSRNKNFPYVWAGSHLKFDQADISKVGTGEGYISQGSGLYAGSNPLVGNIYREKETLKRGLLPKDGSLHQYRVINAKIEEFMHWDGVKQTKEVRDALDKLGIDYKGKTGQQIYREMMIKEGALPGGVSRDMKTAKVVSDKLYEAGIKGNRYADGFTRGKAVTNDNYVFFSDKNLNVDQRFSVGNSMMSAIPQAGDNMQYVTIPFLGWKVPLRMDLWAILQKGEFSEIGNKIFANAVGGSGVMTKTASEEAEILFRRAEGHWRNESQTGYYAWLKDKNLSNWERFKYQGGGSAWRQFNKEAYEANLGLPGNYHPGVQQAVSAAQKLKKDFLEEAKRHGVQGAEHVDAVDTYVNRMFDHDSVTTLMQRIGDVVQGPKAAEKAIHSLISGSIQNARRADPVLVDAGLAKARSELQALKANHADPLTLDAEVSKLIDHHFGEMQATSVNSMSAENAFRKAMLVEARGGKGADKAFRNAAERFKTIKPEKADSIARSYFTTMRTLNYDRVANSAFMGDKEYGMLRAAMEKLADEGKIAKDDIEDVIALSHGQFKRTGDGGNMARLKVRTLLDETHSINVGGIDISMRDLYVNDLDVLTNRYMKQFSGSIGMAKMGFKSMGDLEKALNSTLERLAPDGISDPVRYAQHKKYVEDGIKQIMGVPMHDLAGMGNAPTYLKILRDYNFFRMMGQAGFAQVAELGNTLGQVGWKAFCQQIPSLGEFMKMAKGGKIGDALARDIMVMFGIGSEMMAHPQLKDIAGTFHHKGLAAVENVAEMGKFITSRVSGLASVNNMLHQLSYRMIVQKMVNQAVEGTSKLSPSQIRRLETAGLGGADLDGVFKALNQHAIKDSKGTLQHLDWEAMNKADPALYDTFRMAVWRDARRAVQEQAVGETHPWMHTLLGQVLFQFKAFTYAAHGKQLLNGLAHMDAQTLNSWGFSSLLGGMSYVVQNSINHAGNSEELDKRLSVGEIGKAMFQRAGYSALIPSMVDTVTNFTSYEPVFAHTSTSGLDRGLMGNPTVGLLKDASSLVSNASRSVFDAEYMATKSDAKKGINVFAPNWTGIRNMVNYTADQFPKRNPMHQPKD